MGSSHDGTLTLVTALRIHTLAGATVEAFAVLGERIVATGSAAELVERFTFQQRIELTGTVIPGFNDAHAHPTMTAENLLHVDCSPEVATDEQRLVDLLRAEAIALDAGQWVIGSRYDHSKTTGGRVVDRAFLDAVVPDHPVLLIHVAAHWGVANSAGLRAAGLDRDSCDPAGGALGRDGSGELNGVLYEQTLFDLAYPSLANGPTVVPLSDLAARLRGLDRAQHMFHAAGLTSMTDALCGPDDVRLLSHARRAGRLTLRTSFLVAYPHYDLVDQLGLQSGFGDDQLRFLGIKAFVDGACAGGNCLLDEPFEGTDDHGMQVISTPDLDALVARIAGDGIVLGVHANGDRAIRLLLDAHEKARQGGAPQRRHRIEHCSLVNDDILVRMRALGLVAVPFGSYARFHGDKVVGYYGAQRLERMFPHRSLLESGIPVAGSSDYPCGPFEPLAALSSCVERRALDGTPIGLSQRITVENALHLYTTGAAYACGEEDRKGTLAVGMLADFVELDRDPFQTSGPELAQIGVRSTWVGGRPVHQKI